jgi:3-oxoacyl-[acyl-carrier-protein] synthase-3
LEVKNSFIKPVYLDAVTHYHPDTVLNNAFFERYLETTSSWIQNKVGIRERRGMLDYTGAFPVFEIGRRAVERLVEENNYDLSKIDLIISCSSFEDLQYPGPANLLSEHFKLSVPAFHLKNGCSTVLYAIQVARGLLQLGLYTNILLVNGEPFTRQVDYSDRKSCILFGDASTAMVVSIESGQCEVLELELGGIGSRLITSIQEHQNPQSVFEAAQMQTPSETPNGRFQQSGKDVQEFVVSTMPKKIQAFLASTNQTWNQIDYFIGHQANKSMLDAVCRELEIPVEKHLCNIESFGNVSFHRK